MIEYRSSQDNQEEEIGAKRLATSKAVAQDTGASNRSNLLQEVRYHHRMSIAWANSNLEAIITRVNERSCRPAQSSGFWLVGRCTKGPTDPQQFGFVSFGSVYPTKTCLNRLKTGVYTSPRFVPIDVSRYFHHTNLVIERVQYMRAVVRRGRIMAPGSILAGAGKRSPALGVVPHVFARNPP